MSSIKSAVESFLDLLSSDVDESQYERFEAERDERSVFECLCLVEQLFPDQALMLCNRSHPKLQYVSKNCKEVLGIAANDFLMLPVLDFFKLIHPDDVNGVNQCFNFMNDTEPYDPLHHRFVLYYRLTNGDGKFAHIRDEKLAIKNENGRYIYLHCFANWMTMINFLMLSLIFIGIRKVISGRFTLTARGSLIN